MYRRPPLKEPLIKSRAHQAGVALISVLLIVAILMAVTSRLMASHNLLINRNQNVFEYDQALQYALGAEALARQALYDDFTNTGIGVDHLGEFWAQQVLPFELDEGGFLEAQVTDLHGCFNLNSVLANNDEAAVAPLKKLMNDLGVQPQLADAWRDWVDDDQEVTGFGAEDSEYLIADPPHRTPNVPVFDVSELALLQNITREQLDLLRPEVCLLPDPDSRVNVNTAGVRTLAALHPDIGLPSAEAVASEPREYTEVSEFIQTHPDFAPAQAQLSVTSDYFSLAAQAQVGAATVTLNSTLFRDPTTGEVTVLARDFGKLFRSNVQVDTEE